jgi:hypothetical protein
MASARRAEEKNLIRRATKNEKRKTKNEKSRGQSSCAPLLLMRTRVWSCRERKYNVSA